MAQPHNNSGSGTTITHFQHEPSHELCPYKMCERKGSRRYEHTAQEFLDWAYRLLNYMDLGKGPESQVVRGKLELLMVPVIMNDKSQILFYDGMGEDGLPSWGLPGSERVCHDPRREIFIAEGQRVALLRSMRPHATNEAVPIAYMIGLPGRIGASNPYSWAKILQRGQSIMSTLEQSAVSSVASINHTVVNPDDLGAICSFEVLISGGLPAYEPVIEHRCPNCGSEPGDSREIVAMDFGWSPYRRRSCGCSGIQETKRPDLKNLLTSPISTRLLAIQIAPSPAGEPTNVVAVGLLMRMKQNLDIKDDSKFVWMSERNAQHLEEYDAFADPELPSIVEHAFNLPCCSQHQTPGGSVTKV